MGEGSVEGETYDGGGIIDIDTDIRWHKVCSEDDINVYYGIH